MGQVDTTLKYYGGYNTYRLDPNEEMHASMFDVSLYSDVTIQVVTINPASLASGSVHLCWIDGDNKRIGNIVVESVSVLKRFTEWWKAFEVPENAVRLHWWIKAGSTGFNFGCAMATPGTIRRAFSSNLEDRVSMITADGLYTSTISGNQILAGIIRALTGDAWFDLEKPEIVMKGNDAKWKASPSNPLELTDKNGNFIGGLKKLANKIALVAGLISNDPTLSTYAEIGYPQGGGSGINIVAMDGSTAYISPYGTYFVIMVDGTQRLALYKDGGFVLWDENQVARLNLTKDGDFVVYDGNGTARLYFTEAGHFHVNDGISSVNRIQVYPNGPAGITSGNGNTLGIDDTGAYKIINGTKIYL